jgi:hypothetical protein
VMNPDIRLIITVLYEGRLLKCAMRIDGEKLPKDCDRCWMEEDNKKLLWDKLPLHVQSCGPIVDVEEIFELKDETHKN